MSAVSPFNRRSRRISRWTFFALSAAMLGLAGASGLAFEDSIMDMVLMQITFYSAWGCLLGSRLGGHLGAAIEEDCCFEMDMGVASSGGAFLGALSAGLISTALPGLAFFVSWKVIWGVAVAAFAVHALFGRLAPLALRRREHIDGRGMAWSPQGDLLPEERQPLRMKDRYMLLFGASLLVVMGLTFEMALLMGSDFGHPVMMAPMMYGMFGAMTGGFVGGFMGGVLDEHGGKPEHDNPLMVSIMALMAGMMGAMPASMIGAMMAVMGTLAINITVGAGAALAAATVMGLLWGRYRLQRVPLEQAAAPGPFVPPTLKAPSDPSLGLEVLYVEGMTCDACVDRVTRSLGKIPGVQQVNVQLELGLVQLSTDHSFTGLPAVHQRIDKLGYALKSSTETTR